MEILNLTENEWKILQQDKVYQTYHKRELYWSKKVHESDTWKERERASNHAVNAHMAKFSRFIELFNINPFSDGMP